MASLGLSAEAASGTVTRTRASNLPRSTGMLEDCSGRGPTCRFMAPYFTRPDLFCSAAKAGQGCNEDVNPLFRNLR